MYRATQTLLTAVLLTYAAAVYAQKPEDGTYTFDVAFAEADGQSLDTQVDITFKGDSIRVVYNGTGAMTVPKGYVLEEGTLAKHKSGQWIIIHNPEDVNAPEIGGCEGPSIVDLKGKKYWLC